MTERNSVTNEKEHVVDYLYVPMCTVCWGAVEYDEERGTWVHL